MVVFDYASRYAKPSGTLPPGSPPASDSIFDMMAATATALLLGLIAHDALGMPIDIIRIDARRGRPNLRSGRRRIPAKAEKVKHPDC
jgi:hypothetical protein